MMGQILKNCALRSEFSRLFLPLGECLSHQQGEDQRGLAVDLGEVGRELDLAPGVGLLDLGPRVAAVLEQPRVDEDSVVGAVSPNVGVEDVMLGEAAAQDDHSGLGGGHGQSVHGLDVLGQVHDQIILVGVGEEDIANSTISEARAENWDVVFPGPVVDALLIVDGLPHAGDHLAGGPDLSLALLLLVHFGEKGQQETLQLDVVLVGDQNVTDPAVSVEPVLLVVHVEGTQPELTHAFHEVLLDAAG